MQSTPSSSSVSVGRGCPGSAGRVSNFLFKCILSLAISTTLVTAERDIRSDVIELQTGNWASHMGTGSRYFIKFYAPWCAYCKKLKPVWESLATHVHSSEDPSLSVKIAELDCTRHADVCTKVGVKGYPTLMWVNEAGELYKYSGRMDSKSEFATFIKKQIEDPSYGVGSSNLKAASPSAAGQKTSEKSSSEKESSSYRVSYKSSKEKKEKKSTSSTAQRQTSYSSASRRAAPKSYDQYAYPQFMKLIDYINDEFDPFDIAQWPYFMDLSVDAGDDLAHFLAELYNEEIPQRLDAIEKYLTDQQNAAVHYFENQLGPFYPIDSSNLESKRWAFIKNMYVWGSGMIGLAVLLILWSTSRMEPPEEKDI